MVLVTSRQPTTTRIVPRLEVGCQSFTVSAPSLGLAERAVTSAILYHKSEGEAKLTVLLVIKPLILG
jgi:hypothetical protein